MEVNTINAHASKAFINEIYMLVWQVKPEARNLLVFITYLYLNICTYRLGKPNSPFGHTLTGLQKLLWGQW